MIPIKTKEEIKIMREAGRICALAHKRIEDSICVGITTKELSHIAEQELKRYNATPSFRGYDGFPGAVCISINSEVIHGIPSKKRIVRDGDVVSVDIGACYKRYHGDAARTHLVGNVSEKAKWLLEVTKSAFFAGMRASVEGNRVRDISRAVFEVGDEAGVGVVRDYIGHGVGTELHEDPEIPNFVDKKKGPRLYNGMVLAVEPMFNLGTEKVHILKDDWTVVTDDGEISCHYENTILLTDEGPKILTKI